MGTRHVYQLRKAGVRSVNESHLRILSIAVFAIGYVVIIIAEMAAPLRDRKKSLVSRLPTNAGLTLLAFITGAFIVRPVALWASLWSSKNSIGLLHTVHLPGWLNFIAAFMLMDLTFYYWHRINHTVHLLWRFHSVHHIDPDLDVTTSFRFHFGEILYSTVFRVLQVSLLGIGPVTYVAYELIFTGATLFHHSNLRIPVDIERRLNRVIVTPRMHGIHHSVVRRELNSNYSVIFRWWDTINGSLLLNIPQSAINIGVGRYQNPEDNSFFKLLALPFRAFTRERASGRPRFGASGRNVLAE